MMRFVKRHHFNDDESIDRLIDNLEVPWWRSNPDSRISEKNMTILPKFMDGVKR